MKGDFTRFTHDPEKHYSGVLKQQGRVDLDADWNEADAIRKHLTRITRQDIIGACGTPHGRLGGDGFRISAPTLSRINYVPSLEVEPAARTLWAVGREGTILISTDAGDTWHEMRLSDYPEAWLHDSFFLDEWTGWLAGDGGLILMTQDGGVTWDKLVSTTTKPLFGIHAPTANRSLGWAYGGEGTLLETADGVQWVARDVGQGSARLKGGWFSEERGCIVGEDLTILVTIDSGATWMPASFGGNPPPSNANVHLHAVTSLSDGRLCAVGDHGTILVSEDASTLTTWAVLHEEGQKEPELIDVHAALIGGTPCVLAVGVEGAIFASSDEATFTDMLSPCGLTLHGIRVIGDRAVAVGVNGLIQTLYPDGMTHDVRPHLSIRAGRYYAGGVLAQLEDNVRYDEQPDLPDAPAIEPSAGRTDLVYLDVWERSVVAAEESALRDVALGGADTTTRTQTMAQVRVEKDVGANYCDEIGSWVTLPDGKLSARFDEPQAQKSECYLAPVGGYQGLENRLYRIEIHQGGDLSNGEQPTFKWSNENASVAYAATVDGQDESKLSLGDFGKDEVLALAKGQWIEVIAKDGLKSGVPGTLRLISEDTPQGTLTLTTKLDPSLLGTEVLLIRWGDRSDLGAAEFDIQPSTPFELEDGIFIEFSGNTFRAGDYWTFPVRTAAPKADLLKDELPHGVRHRRCPLALVTWDTWPDGVQDCRRRFASLTEMVRFFHVGGTGQTLRLDEPEVAQALAQPLEVGVASGQWPIQGAKVQFSVDGASSGELRKVASSSAATSVIVETDAEGIARCEWILNTDHEHRNQHVEATLLTPSGSQFAGADTLSFDAFLIVPVYSVRMLGGDGQEDTRADHILPCPLEVCVEDEGGRPVSGVDVRFKRICGDECDNGPSNDACQISPCAISGPWVWKEEHDVTTGSDGIAKVHWKLASGADCHTVAAYLVDRKWSGTSHAELPQVRFHAWAAPENVQPGHDEYDIIRFLGGDGQEAPKEGGYLPCPLTVAVEDEAGEPVDETVIFRVACPGDSCLLSHAHEAPLNDCTHELRVQTVNGVAEAYWNVLDPPQGICHTVEAFIDGDDDRIIRFHAHVAPPIAASDVVTTPGTCFASTNVQSALQDICNAIGGNGGTPGSGPVVESHTWVHDGAIPLETLNEGIRIWFSESMDPATINNQTLIITPQTFAGATDSSPDYFDNRSIFGYIRAIDNAEFKWKPNTQIPHAYFNYSFLGPLGGCICRVRLIGRYVLSANGEMLNGRGPDAGRPGDDFESWFLVTP